MFPTADRLPIGPSWHFLAFLELGIRVNKSIIFLVHHEIHDWAHAAMYVGGLHLPANVLEVK